MISVVHPSRGRPEIAFKCYNEWKKNAVNDFDYVLSIDADDPKLNEYLALFDGENICVGNSKNVVDAMNLGASESRGDVIVCISDDFSCPEDWDSYIISHLDKEKEQALRVNDGHIMEGTDCLLLTIPIMTRKLYERLGYIYFPKFHGMYADNHLGEYCDKLGVLVTNYDKVFLHKHWVHGYGKKDETNQRHDNPESWHIGRQLIKQFRENNYGIKT